jgi:hypothetical protein
MKNKLVFVMFVLCLMLSVAPGQTDATGTVTDDETMVRLRVGHLVLEGPNVDVLINGEIAMFGLWELVNLSCCGFTGHMYLSPGAHSVALVPNGKGMDEALIGPLDLTLEAGHRYTLAMVGQATDESLTPLVIDETAALEEARTDPSQTIMILINNLAGTETLNFAHDGQGPQNIPYKGFVAAPVPTGSVEHLSITTDVGTIYEGPFVASNNEPGIDYIGSFTGRFPGTEDVDNRYVQGPVAITDLNAPEFLRGFSGRGVHTEQGDALSFDTFLAAVERAGLAEMLETGSPYWLLAPTNEAFAAVPQDRLDALMADPEALADLVRNHIAEGYEPDLPWPRTNMLGTELEGIPAVGGLYLLTDGSHLSLLSTVLMPPDEACIAAQTAQLDIPPRPLEENIVGMWLFDEGEGSVASDASGHSHHGTFVNADWAEGKYGSAAHIIPGENYIEVETTEGLSPAKEMTITAWVYLEELPDLEEQFPNHRILEAATYNPDEFQYGGADNHYGLHFEWGNFIFRPGRAAFPERVGIDQGESIEPGGWQHVAGVYSGDHIRLYINGELRSEVEANCMTLVQPADNRLFIGTKAPQAPEGDWWNGLLDEVAIFDVALTEEEIRIIMQGLGAMRAD